MSFLSYFPCLNWACVPPFQPCLQLIRADQTVRPRLCIRSSMTKDMLSPASLRRWHQLQCCRTRLPGDHRVNIGCAVSLILRLIGSIDLVIERLIGACIHKRHVLRHPASSNTSLMPLLDMTEPGSFTTTVCPHVQIITDANDPDRDRLSKCAILLERHKLQFICRSNSSEVIICPTRHCRASLIFS